MASPAAADEAFAADLYRELATSPGGLVFSPASVAAALRLALLGARGDTAAELAAALHLDRPEAAAEGLRQLGDLPAGRETAGGETAELVFRAPNTAWVQAGLPLEPQYVSAVGELASAAVREADFAAASEQARLDINALIEKETAGKIRDLLARGSIGTLTRLVLTNAVYLKAAWVHQFPAGATGDAPFHPAPATTVTVPTMRLTARLGYLQGDGYQAVTLPYRGGGLAMAVILPDGPPGAYGPVAGRLAGAGVSGLLAGSAQRQVRLALPRFRLAAKFDLVPVLRELGVRLAFGSGADFSGITRAERLAVDAAVHQAYIDVDEKGTEAAAATGVAMVALAMTRDQPVEVTVDRPFLFAITDTATGLPLFLGRVTDPSAR